MALGVGTALPGCASIGPVREEPKPAHFVLWQLPSQTSAQMNSYVMRTRGGKVIVIDGGNKGDAPYLEGFLAALGHHVHAWFISHPHPDHVDALTVILSEAEAGDPNPLAIDRIYGSMPPVSEVRKYETWSPVLVESVEQFNLALQRTGRRVEELQAGQLIVIDSVRFEILGVRNPQITSNYLNNSSVAMRVSDARKSVLFTGDLGVQGGRKLLDGPFRDRLRADYVQMAHHGQRGVDEDFYVAVSPKYCLWPTPRWLWDNDKGEGKGSGDWDTLNVRAWMDRLGVRRHYVCADGLHRIE